MKLLGAGLLWAASLLGADAAGKGHISPNCVASANAFQLSFMDGNLEENVCVSMLVEQAASRTCWGRLNVAEYSALLTGLGIPPGAETEVRYEPLNGRRFSRPCSSSNSRSPRRLMPSSRPTVEAQSPTFPSTTPSTPWRSISSTSATYAAASRI